MSPELELDLFGAPAAPEPLANDPLVEAAPPADQPELAAPPSVAALGQETLFGLDEFYVAPPDADIKAALAAKGVTPAAKLKVFQAATIKQIVTYWPAGDYERTLDQLERLMHHYAVDNHTEALACLLNDWTAAHDHDRLTADAR